MVNAISIHEFGASRGQGMSFMSQIEVTTPRIAVFGVGGAGGNGVADLIGEDLPNVALIAANTDAQALRGLGVHDQLQLGRTATQGLGAGAWPEVGRAAAQEVVADIEAALDGVDFCFIAAGMGGGTGTGAAPIFAECAKKRGIPTVAVVTRPFEFEGARRAARADQGIALLEPLVDAIIVVPNQRLLGIGDLDMTFRSAMHASDGVLADGLARAGAPGDCRRELLLRRVPRFDQDLGSRFRRAFAESTPDVGVDAGASARPGPWAGSGAGARRPGRRRPRCRS